MKATTTALVLALKKNALTTESADTQKHADKLCSEAQLIISRNEIRIQPHQDTLDLNESILHLNSADRTHRSREVSETHDQTLHRADVHQSDIREDRLSEPREQHVGPEATAVSQPSGTDGNISAI